MSLCEKSNRVECSYLSVAECAFLVSTRKLQDIFLEIWESRSEFETADNVYRYIYSRAKYYSLNFLKKRVLDTVEIQASDGDSTPDAQSIYEAQELALKVELAVNKMPEQRQKVFKLSRYEGLKRSEIAEKLEITPHTVTQHLTKAMEDLKKLLVVALVLGKFIK